MNNKEFWSRYKYLILFIVIFTISGVSIFNIALTPEKKLPIYSPSMVSSDLVDDELKHVKKYHKISDFNLVNQNGIDVTQNNYDKKIYVADFFFTTCPTICPIMTGNMVFLQNQLSNQDIMFASFSVTPDIDSVEVLKKYALEKGVDDKKWNLMTGDKKQIYNLARKSFLVVKDDPQMGSHDMIHTENFVLVDKEKRIRGFYDGTKIEEMNKIISDIKILQDSYNKS
jgi:protein SCO1/2|tara:strand:- start:581 stop:1261 length:681 start_codon:yes stop_codon:yes gene_type:complete